MKYKIVIEHEAMKFLLRQPQEQREHLLKAINKLPDVGDIKPMVGHKDLYRLRVGSYRVIYTVENDLLIVRVLTVGNRGDVYK